MAATPAYRIDIEEQEIVVRLPRTLLNREEVSTFLDYLELQAVRRRSELSQEQAETLAEEIDRSTWELLRSRIPKTS
jgi:hypothetical protein